MDFDVIIELEKKLLDPTVRRDSTLLENLLSDDFQEFGTSGRIYDKKITIEQMSEEGPIVIEPFDFVPIQLAPSVVQLRFKTRRKNDDGSFSASLRSSIWKKTSKNWQLVFHQGTGTSL